MMVKTVESRTIGVSISRERDEVYQFLAEPANFPLWASGLCKSIRPHGELWIAETRRGPVKVRFTAPNAFGIVDHYVSASSDSEIYVPMRVIANGAGCEVLLTLFRQPGMSDAKFGEDVHWVERDLQVLKTRLEK